MDEDFDEALRKLAEHQITHNVGSILLALALPSGDVVISIPRKGRGDFIPYARVNCVTKQIVRLRL
jgi:hypothetical protein